MDKESKFGFHIGQILLGTVTHGFITHYFYEVVGFTEKMVKIRELKKGTDCPRGYAPCWTVWPIKGEYASDVIRKIPCYTDSGKPYLVIRGYIYAFNWRGKTETEYSD